MLTYKVDADPKKLAQTLKNTAKKSISEGASQAKTNTISQTQKTTTGESGESVSEGVTKGLGKAAAIASIVGFLAQLKPIADGISLLTGLLGFAVFQILIGVKKSILKSTEFLSNLKDNITSFATKTVKELVGLGVTLGKKLREVWNKITSTISGLPSQIWSSLKQGFTQVVDFVKSLPSKIWEALKTGFQTVKETLTTVKNFIVESLRTAFTSVIGGLQTVFETVKDAVIDVYNAVKDGFGKATEFIKSLPTKFESAIQVLGETLSGLWDTLKDLSKRFIENVKSLPGKIWGFIKQGFDALKNSLQNLGGVIADKIRGAIQSINPFSTGTSVNDAIITKTGQVVRTNPNDTIIATQNPAALPGNTGSNNASGVTLNFYGVTTDDMIQRVEEVLGERRFEQDRF